MYLPQTDTELRNALLDAADLAVKAFAAQILMHLITPL